MPYHTQIEFTEGGRKKMNTNKILTIVLYVVLIGGIAYAAYATKGFGLMKGKDAATGEYQAVFLTNGQVYFGKLSGENGQWATLKDIYYLQVQQQVQPKDSTDQAAADQGLTLVKLGNELHGPVDSMSINRDQILFWEDIKSDGKVVEAIKKYQTEGPSPAPATPTK